MSFKSEVQTKVPEYTDIQNITNSSLTQTYLSLLYRKKASKTYHEIILKLLDSIKQNLTEIPTLSLGKKVAFCLANTIQT